MKGQNDVITTADSCLPGAAMKDHFKLIPLAALSLRASGLGSVLLILLGLWAQGRSHSSSESKAQQVRDNQARAAENWAEGG